MTLRLTAVHILITCTLTAFAGASFCQQNYPSRPIRFVVPYPPGGSDQLARLIGQKLSENLGQPVVLDYRTGASGTIGADLVAKAPPDGYTILLMNSTFVLSSLLMPTPYDIIKDFAPITTVVKTEYVLAVAPSLPVNNLQELIALAKSQPGKLNYSTSGNGNGSHLAGELFSMLAGIKILQIPYKGAGPAMIDLMSGRVQMAFNSTSFIVPLVQSGKVKAIAVTGERRLSALPQLPTFAEGGLPSFDMKSWQGVLAPGATPKSFTARLSTEIVKILDTADVKKTLDGQGQSPFPSTPDQFATLLKTEQARFANIIKTANIKLD
jgi:tripartite-type tricarboxylate transporter receptor subunit TctC